MKLATTTLASAPLLGFGPYAVTTLLSLSILSSNALHTPANAAATTRDREKTIVATAVRRRGFVCDRPERASRKFDEIKPHETEWILYCENSVYKIKFLYDRRVEIEQLRQETSAE